MSDEATMTTPTTAAAPQDWRSFLTDDLKADPVVSSWAEKAPEKDMGSVLKSLAHANKRLGSAINLPGKDAKPEEVQALKQRLYEAGVFKAPPAGPEAYTFQKPEHLPEGVAWSDELSGKFASALHKHGVPPEAMQDLMPLYLEAITGASQALKTDTESGMAALRQEHGEKFDEYREAVRRMSGAIFKSQEELDFFNHTGLGDHPAFLSVMMRLAPLALQDSSFMETVPVKGGQISGEEARTQYADILSNPQNKWYEAFKRRDPKAEAHVNELYKQAYGNEKVRIGEGVGVG